MNSINVSLSNIKRYFRGDAVRESLEQLEKKMSNISAQAISNNIDSGKGKLIPISEFKDLQPGTWFHQKNGMDTFCLAKDEDKITFIAITEKGVTTGIHKHDVEEIFEVLKGGLKETISGVEVKEKETICISPLVLHGIEPTEYSIYVVYLKLK